jgi:hypothetical protein
MLTDEEIRKLMETMRDTIAGDTIAELCTRLLASEARVKVLEDALEPFGRHAWSMADERIFPDGMLIHFPIPADAYRRAHKAMEAGR